MMLKEAFVVLFEVLPRNFLERAEEKRGSPELQQLALWQSLNLRPSPEYENGLLLN
jgi:hypothetical protein